MLQPWVYQFKGVGASSPNTPWNLSRWGTRCCERDEEREKQKQLLTACQGDRREKGRLLVYHHWKMVIVSNKETTSDHNQNTEQLGRDLLFAATGMIKGRQKPTRWCSQVVQPGGQNLSWQERGNWSVMVNLSCGRALTVFLRFSHLWRRRCDFYIAAGQTELGLGLVSLWFWIIMCPTLCSNIWDTTPPCTTATE